MDRPGNIGERDNPKSLLLPGTLPLPVHTLIEMDEGSGSDDNLPSTIDLDAIKGAGLTDSPFLNMNMGWRSPPRVKAKPFHHETPKRDQSLLNGLETESQSDESNKNSDGSSSESEDSESESESSSGSDSSADSSSSESSESSESRSSGDSVQPSSKSSNSPRKKLTSRPTQALKLPNLKAKDTQSRSNSSTSSRSRRVARKSFSVQSNYAAGSLKLKIAAFDPSRSAQAPVQDNKIPSPGAINFSPKPVLQTASSTAWNPVNGDGDSPSLSSSLKIPPVPVVINGGTTEFPTSTWSSKNTAVVPLSLGKDSRRITRQSLTQKSNIEDSLTVIQTGGSSLVQKNGFTSPEVLTPPSVKLVTLDKKIAKEPYSQNVNQFCFSNNKNNFVPVGVSSQLTESVTMTRLIAAPAAQDAPIVSPQLNSASAAIHALPHLATRSRNDQHLADPLLYLTSKNNDLSIFPINPTDARIPSWNSNVDSPKVVISAQPPVSSSNSGLRLSPAKSSRRVSTHKMSIDKADVESRASTELSVLDAIKRVDSVVNSDKPIPLHVLSKKSTAQSRLNKTESKVNQSSNGSSSSSSGYNSPQLENSTKLFLPLPAQNSSKVRIGSGSKHSFNIKTKPERDLPPKPFPAEQNQSSNYRKPHKHDKSQREEKEKGKIKSNAELATAKVKTVSDVKAVDGLKLHSMSSGSTSSSSSSTKEASKPNKSKLSIFVASNSGKSSSRPKNGRHNVVGAYTNNTKMPSSLGSNKTTTGAGSKNKKRERKTSQHDAPADVILTGHQTLSTPSVPNITPEPVARERNKEAPYTPIRTKAAKKYIPEVVPRALEPEVAGSRKWKKHGDRKRVSKKSSGGRKFRKGVLSDEELGLLCQRLTLQCTITGPLNLKSNTRSPKKKKAKSSSPRGKKEAPKERFTFEKIVFKNFVTSFTIPPPSFVTNGGSSTSTSPSSLSCFTRGVNAISSPPRTPTQMHKLTPQASSSSTQSRRKRNVVHNKISTPNDGASESPTELQRLPLKKRHGHTSQNYNGAQEEPDANLAIFGPPKFATKTLDKVKVFPVSTDTVTVFGGNSCTFPTFSDIFRASSADVKTKTHELKRKLKPVPGRRSSRVRNNSEKTVPADTTNAKLAPSIPAGDRKKSVKYQTEDRSTPSLKRSLGVKQDGVENKRVKLSEVDTDDMVPDDNLPAHQSLEKRIAIPAVSPKPANSPQSSPTGTKKRRKVNRTGFPSVKKKKKSANWASTEDPALQAPAQENTFEEIDSSVSVDDLTAASPKIKPERDIKTEVESPPTLSSPKRKLKKGSPATSSLEVKSEAEPQISELKVEQQYSKNGEAFSSSLTERVKIRKRNSVDGITAQDQAKILSGEIVIPDVVPSLLNVPDPPIIVPEKTNYLVAGLLSDHFKYLTPPPIITAEEAATTWESSGPILPPPGDLGFNGTGGSVLEQPSAYELPFDIWCLGVIRTKEKYEEWVVEEENRRARARIEQKKVAQSRKAGVVKPKKIQMPAVPPDSWNFKRLRSNAYFGFAKPPVSTEAEVDQLCECRESEFKCGGEDCLNRVVFTECPSACGENCLNRRIQKHEWAPDIRRFLTEDKGYGVKTMKSIKQGDFILEYVGEVVQDAVFKERMNTIYVNDTHHYCLQLDSGRVIDGHRSGGEGRFVNHSCEPNCEMQKWSVNGLSRMALFALRDIQDNEELSYDYNFSLYNPSEGQICHCKSKNCRGVIGGKSKTNALNAKSKRKSGNSKGLSGRAVDASGAPDPCVLDKMKVLTRKDRNAIAKSRCFLLRNYEKMRRHRGDVEDVLGDRLEKLMSSWILRFKVGSTKNKPLVVGDDDPELSRVARIAQIIYELYCTVINTKDGSGKLLCEPFMEVPPKRKYPVFNATLTQTKLLGFRAIEKNILRGKYRVIQTFEADVRLVLSSFSQAYEAEKPDAKDLVLRITSVYKEAKQKAIQALDPFIVSHGTNSSTLVGQRRSSSVNSLPPFVHVDLSQCEDVVRCICGTFSEEGEMVQCETCLVWQHTDCMRWVETANTSTKSRRGKLSNGKKFRNSWSPKKTTPKSIQHQVLNRPTLASARTLSTDSDEKEKVEFDTGEVVSVKEALPLLEPQDDAIEGFSGMDTPVSDVDVNALEYEALSEPVTPETVKSVPYYCELCQPREIDPEVPMNGDNDTPVKKHYLTLKREDGLLVRKNDTVYVLRDRPVDQRLGPDGTPLPRKTYLTAGPLVPSECDIFRIDQLYKDDKGNRMALGYNYLRPHETHHEPSRKFYPNEILRAPIHEAIDIDLIHGHCWVVDTPTYCKGRPKGCIEEHLYICDMRVDRLARSFDKVGKKSQMVCTKPFAFENFSTKLKIQRNFHPHGPPSPDFKSKVAGSSTGSERGRPRKTEDKGKKAISASVANARRVKQRTLKVKRLHVILDNLHLKVVGFVNDVIVLPEVLMRDEKRKDKARKIQSLRHN